MQKLNGVFDRIRGLFLILVPVMTVAAGVTSFILVTRSDIGYSQTTPTQRIERVEDSIAALSARVEVNRKQTRPLLVSLCFTASDTVLALIRNDLRCEDLIPQRVQR